MVSAKKLHIADSVSTVLPEAAPMEFRIGLKDVQLISISWKWKYVILRIGTLVVYDHRKGVVKAWQQAQYWSESRLAQVEAWEKTAYYRWANELDLEISEWLKLEYDRAERLSRKTYDRFDKSKDQLGALYSGKLDQIAMVDPRLDKQGNPYLVISDATTTETDEFLTTIFDDNHELWGVCFHTYGGWNHNLILHGKGVGLTELY